MPGRPGRSLDRRWRRQRGSRSTPRAGSPDERFLTSPEPSPARTPLESSSPQGSSLRVSCATTSAQELLKMFEFAAGEGLDHVHRVEVAGALNKRVLNAPPITDFGVC